MICFNNVLFYLFINVNEHEGSFGAKILATFFHTDSLVFHSRSRAVFPQEHC